MDETDPAVRAAPFEADRGAGTNENRVLLLLGSEHESARASEEITRVRLAAQVCTSLESLIERIKEGAGAAVLTGDVLTGGMAPLFSVFDGQSTWSDLPVIVLVGRDVTEHSLASLRAFARHPKIKTTFLQQPVPPISLISAVRSGLKARRRQYQVRDLLAQLNEDVRRRDQFLAMLGHELRNPVTSIGYVAEIFQVRGQSPSPERLKWGADVINRQVRHLSRMLDQLLDVARVQSGKIELDTVSLDLRELTQQCAESFAAIARARNFSVALPSGSVMVCGDRVRLVQAIENLLDNALKYTQDQGRIDLQLSIDGCAHLTITDDGRGIEPAAVPHVFEPFFQEQRGSREGHAGLGLGLAMVDNIVRLHGGTVGVNSDGLSRGSRFHLSLPLARGVQPEPVGARADPLPPLRLLIVEDDAELAEIFATLLKSLGHEPHVVNEGERGVEMAAALAPDMVFIDLGLPDVDGSDVAARIRAALGAAAPPLVAMTAYARQESDSSPFDDYLQKPVARERVEQVFRELVVGTTPR